MASSQRRRDDLRDVLCPIGGGDQCFGAWIQVVDAGVVEDRSQSCADVGAAGLAGEHRADRLGQTGRLRRLAAALAAFERDVGRGFAHDRRWYPVTRRSVRSCIPVGEVTKAHGRSLQRCVRSTSGAAALFAARRIGVRRNDDRPATTGHVRRRRRRGRP